MRRAAENPRGSEKKSVHVQQITLQHCLASAVTELLCFFDLAYFSVTRNAATLIDIVCFPRYQPMQVEIHKFTLGDSNLISCQSVYRMLL